ncbi:hypothetical protein [Paenibacillus sp. FSL K6-1230]|uniref:hypothetical protein n=1 Tax=Paenibacillus sp. FSL K6-1230 TaxID=2921603 RepID=UPI0030FBD6F8
MPELIDQETVGIIEEGGEKHQQDIEWFTPGVEDEASGEQNDIPQLGGRDVISEQSGGQKLK